MDFESLKIPVFWLVLGLVAGWNFLPQPTFIKNIFDKILGVAKEDK